MVTDAVGPRFSEGRRSLQDGLYQPTWALRARSSGWNRRVDAVREVTSGPASASPNRERTSC